MVREETSFIETVITNRINVDSETINDISRSNPNVLNTNKLNSTRTRTSCAN